MEISTWGQTAANLGIGLIYAIVTLVVSIATLVFVDRVFYREIDFVAEIKRGNIAASLFYSVVLLFVALIVTTAIN